MFVPFVGPEDAVVALVAGPVRISLVIRRRSVALQNRTDTAVAARSVATVAGALTAGASIRPQTMLKNIQDGLLSFI